MRTPALSLWLLVSCLAVVGRADVTLDLSTARLTLDARGAVAAFTFNDGTRWPASGQPAMVIEGGGKTWAVHSITRAGDALNVEFDDGTRARFHVVERPGLVLLRLETLDPRTPIDRLRLFRLVLPAEAKLGGTLNAGYTDRWVAAVMAATPNVEARSETTGSYRADRPGGSHRFVRIAQARAGGSAAEFTATADARPGGWSVRGKPLDRTLDLTGCHAVRAWVHGDGKGEQLKIQLFDGAGGYRDNYVPIDFKGWRQVTLTNPPYNTLRYDHVTTLNIYYNSLPPGQTVTCLVDQVEAIVDRGGKEEAILLEDFEPPESAFFATPGVTLDVVAHRTHGLDGSAFAVLAAPRADFWTTVERFEGAAGIPSPRLGGAWNKTSPAIRRSYFFLTDFGESQFDEALAIARRGGFAMILLGQESWSRGTGHYEIDRDRFPDGLDGLKRTIGRFHAAGFGVGLHFLGASVYPPDPYITPVPDRRLVTGAATTLATDIDEQAAFLPTTDAPQTFPADDGGYEGAGTVLRIGDELITYGGRSLSGTTGFKECRRGHLGTRPAAHRKGQRVAHLVRAYGYHMYDMDTTLIDEVAAHFARVADACKIDMIYFDGSEQLQGDHWYYNARLHKAFLDALGHKDILLQASSYSHYSWHLMARTASADGHGDLKGYLDERSPWFDSYARDGMPLDIGWYYGYDPNSTLDQYEYILGATIGYDSSMSYQVSPAAAARHPFTGPLLDLIRRYEALRLSGRVPEAMRVRLHIDPVLGGPKTAAERDRMLDRRREYRLVGPEGHEVFQRVAYGPWREIRLDGESLAGWTTKVVDGPAQIGAWVHAQAGPWLSPGASYRAPDAVTFEAFDDLAPYTSAPGNRRDVRTIAPGEAGSVSPGVSQRLELRDDGAREGRRYAVYSASSTRPDPGGWSAIGRSFDPPLDLSGHRGLAFWMRGDGHGGHFKVQLRDATGAMDYYIANDFEGWHYQQLARPEKDAIDYAKVRSLTFYYNGLPGKRAVSCGIDDLKALPSLDRPGLTDPWVEVGGRRFEWKGTLAAGQYLVFWPEGTVARFGPPLKEPELAYAAFGPTTLPAGEHPVRYGTRGGAGLPVRVRVMLQPPERHELPLAPAVR